MLRVSRDRAREMELVVFSLILFLSIQFSLSLYSFLFLSAQFSLSLYTVFSFYTVFRIFCFLSIPLLAYSEVVVTAISDTPPYSLARS